MQIITNFILLAVICFSSINSNGQFIEYETFEKFEKEFFHKLDPEKKYIINFWATWCKPCVKELPYFEDVTLKALDDVEVILVSLDFKKQIEKKLIPFLEKRKLKSKVLLLTDGKYNDWIDRIDPKWSGSIPATLFIANGNKYFVEREFHSAEEILSDLTALN